MAITLEQIKKESILGYTAYSGIELLEAENGHAFGRIRLQDHHRNPSGAVHGGVIFCLADVMGGTACRTLDALPVTVSSTISYMRPMLGGEVIYARADIIRRGKTTIFVEVRVLNDSMEETAMLQGTYYDMSSRQS